MAYLFLARRETRWWGIMIAAKHVRMSGVILLVAGLLAAAIISCTAQPDEQLEMPGVDLATKRDNLQMEKIGGKSYILFNDLNEWFASSWHGRRLAYTIGILSIVGFVGSRWFADLVENAPASDGMTSPQMTKTPKKAPERGDDH